MCVGADVDVPLAASLDLHWWLAFVDRRTEAAFAADEWPLWWLLRVASTAALLAVSCASALDFIRKDLGALPALSSLVAVPALLQVSLLAYVMATPRAAPRRRRASASRWLSVVAAVCTTLTGASLSLLMRLCSANVRSGAVPAAAASSACAAAAAGSSLPWLSTAYLPLLPLLLACGLRAHWLAVAASAVVGGASFCALVLAPLGSGQGVATAVTLLIAAGAVAAGAAYAGEAAARAAFRRSVAERRKLAAEVEAALAAHVLRGQSLRLIEAMRRTAFAVAEVSAGGLVRWALPPADTPSGTGLAAQAAAAAAATEAGGGAVLGSWLVGVDEEDAPWLRALVQALAGVGAAHGASLRPTIDGETFAAGGAAAGSAHVAVPALAARAPALHRRVRFRRPAPAGFPGRAAAWAEAEIFAVMRPPRLWRGITAAAIAEQASVIIVERDITHDHGADKIAGVVSGEGPSLP